MVNANHVLTHHDGVARGMLLHEFGLSRRMLSTAVRDGEVVRVRNGVFASLTADRDVVTAAAHGGALTCPRALRLHGIWVLEDDAAVHVWMGTHGRRHHDGCTCVGHFFEGTTALGVAPLVDALVHAWQCHGDETFFAAFESALEQRKISRAAQAEIRKRLPQSARWLVDLARSDAGSGLESVLRLRLHLLGIRLDCQIDIPTVGVVDFVADKWLIIEVDGRENHDGESLRHKDLVRDAAASALGYETLRFDYAQVIHNWDTVAVAIVAAVERLRTRG